MLTNELMETFCIVVVSVDRYIGMDSEIFRRSLYLKMMHSLFRFDILCMYVFYWLENPSIIYLKLYTHKRKNYARIQIIVWILQIYWDLFH